MNRRKLLKTLAIASAALPLSTLHCFAKDRRSLVSSDRRPLRGGIRVVFSGLWLFDIVDDKTVIAFTPELDSHSIDASFSDFGSLGKLDRSAYMVVTNAKGSLNKASLLANIRGYDSGVLLKGATRVNGAKIKTISLPMPDDIVPVLSFKTSDILDISVGDLKDSSVAEVRSSYPDMQVFCYDNAVQATFKGDVGAAIPFNDSTHLHITTRPPVSSFCDGGAHTKHAIKESCKTIQVNGQPLNIQTSPKLSDCLGSPSASNQVLAGLSDAEIPHSIVCPNCASFKRHAKGRHLFTHPANCGGGGGTFIYR